MADGAERGARRDEIAAVARREAHAERSGHAAARVRRATAAEGDHDAAVARIERLADELARAEGRRVGSGEAGQPVLQARSLRELHIGRVARAQIARAHGLAAGAGRAVHHEGAADGVADDVERALAAVGGRDGRHLRVRHDVERRLLHDGAETGGGKAPLEGVGNQQNFHDQVP